MTTNNRGIDLVKERLDQRGDEWQFGAASQPGIAVIPQAERENYLPIGENQFGAEDFMDCATRAPVQKIDMDLDYLYDNNLLTQENKNFFDENGYRVNGQFACSKRFIAILSGTTRSGNSLKAPVDAIHKYGLIPESMLPQRSDMTFDEYHRASDITQKMKDLGQEFLKRFPINYEQVPLVRLPKLVEDEGAIVALYAWPQPINGIYPAVPDAFDHAILLFKPRYFAFDNYQENPGDYIKQLAPDYVLYDYGYRIYIAAQNTFTPEQKKSLLILLYQKLLAILGKVKENIPAQPAPMPKYDFSTKAAARHSVRVICDEMGLPLYPTFSVDGNLYTAKDVICACIQQESNFDNKAIGRNLNKDGSVSSIDYGICQINSYWQIGPGKPFKDVADVVDNPEKAVRFMVTMMKAGKLSLWSSYKYGAFKKYLPAPRLGRVNNQDLPTMSKEYISFVVMLLATLLPKIGVALPSEDLTTAISVVVTIVAGLAGMAARYNKGDITLFGKKK